MMKKILIITVLMIGTVAWARLFAQSYANPIKTSFSAATTPSTVLFAPSNGVNICAITICNTGAFRVAVWGGMVTNITVATPVGGGASLTITNIDNTVTNVNNGGYVLQPTNGVITIQIDGLTDKRSWYGHGLGGTALGTVVREIKSSQP